MGLPWRLRICVLLYTICQSVTSYKIALDGSGTNTSYMARGLCGKFRSRQLVSVQLWEKNRDYEYILAWERRFSPRQGGCATEAFPFDEPVEVMESYLIGLDDPDVISQCPPETEVGQSDYVIVSKESNQTLAPKLALVFDDLQIPFTKVPVRFCRQENCTDCVEPTTTPTPVTSTKKESNNGPILSNPKAVKGKTSSRFEEIIQEPDFMVGMIVWNIILTVIIFSLILTLICITHQINKLKRNERRTVRAQTNAAYVENYSTLDSTLPHQKRLAQAEFDSAPHFANAGASTSQAN